MAMLSAHVVSDQISLRGVADAWLIAYPALFSIVNPFGAALIFAQVTHGHSRATCLALARQVAVYSFVIMLVSLLFGSLILSFFGITIDALRITGGLVVAIRAWAMLQAPEESEARKERQARGDGHDAEPLESQAFFPLAMPFTVGPGSISVLIALSAQRMSGVPVSSYFAGLVLATIVMGATVAIVYAYAERIVAALGTTGTRIVSRIAALILLAIGVQILIGGVQGVALTIMRPE